MNTQQRNLTDKLLSKELFAVRQGKMALLARLPGEHCRIRISLFPLHKR